MTRRVPAEWLAILLLVCFANRSSAQTDFSDAEYLACDLSDSLLAPDSLVARFDHDLLLIRQHTPAVADVRHSCERLRIGAVGLTFSYGAEVLFLASQHEGLNNLHAQLGNPQVVWLLGYSCIFYYPHPYDPARLVDLHTGIDGISSVHAVTPCIGDGPDIVLRPDGAYQFRNAWGDGCLVGACDYAHVWVFRVDGEVVTLIDEYGDPVPVERVTWGTVKTLFR
jgi:hypothetical protein